MVKTDKNTENSKNSNKKAEEDKKLSTLKEIVSWIEVFVIAAVIAFFINTFIITNSTVPSGSMENTINQGDRVVGLRLTYYFSEPQTGDIAIFKWPDDRKIYYVKRVIGTPGDVVDIVDGKVYVNDVELDDSYIKEPMNTDWPDMHFEVPEDHYFFMGDNRNNSYDSRFWNNTYVPKKDVLAKVYFRYWPLSNMGKVE